MSPRPLVLLIACQGDPGPSRAADAAVCETLASLVDNRAWTLVAPPPPPDGGGDVAAAAPDAAPDGLPTDAASPDGTPADGGSDRPAAPAPRGPCGLEAIGVEMLGAETSFTINTTYCSGATVEQPSLIDVAAGEPINYRIWHFPLDRLGPPAQAHVRLSLGDQLLLDKTLDLPGASGLLYPGRSGCGPVAAAGAAPAGAPIRWQVENHGANSYNLVEVSVLRPGPCPDGAAP